MSHSAGDSPASTEPVQVSRDAVTLDRDIEIREEGVVVTYRLTADGDEALSASVADVLPEELPTDEAGFHPDNEPYEWSVTDRDVEFETVVPDEGQRIVVFGIAHAAEADEVTFPDPELTTVDGVNPAVAGEDMDVTLPDVDEPDRADAIAEVIQGGGDAASGDDAEAPTEPDESADGDDGDGDATEASSDEIEAALEGLSEADDPEAPADDGDIEDLDVDDGGPADAGTDTADADDAPDPAADEGDDGGAGPAPSATPEPDRADGLVEALLAELESDAVTESDRAALAAALDVDGPDVESMDVRLSHVQSRMDDYAAYADALEEIIDEHGTAEAFMAEIREQVDLVDGRVEDVHERLDDLTARLDEVAADASDRDAEVADLEDDILELRSEVETVHRVRDSLLDAFGDADDGSD